MMEKISGGKEKLSGPINVQKKIKISFITQVLVQSKKSKNYLQQTICTASTRKIWVAMSLNYLAQGISRNTGELTSYISLVNRNS